jgi:hypothetical protein
VKTVRAFALALGHSCCISCGICAFASALQFGNRRREAKALRRATAGAPIATFPKVVSR